MSVESVFHYPEVAVRGAAMIDVAKVHLSDTYLAEGIARVLHGRVLYYRELNKWLVWNGKKWELDPPGGLFPFIKDIIRSLLFQALKISSTNRAEITKELFRYEGYYKQKTLISALSVIPRLITKSENLDRHVMMLNCNNGMIDLEKGILLNHSSKFRFTKIVHVDYDANATCPRFMQFLEQIFAQDEAMIGYIRRFFGYCLTGKTTEQVLVFFFGQGANGKTTLANILTDLLAEFSASASAELLTYKDNPSVSNDIARLAGKRVVAVNEVEEGKRLAEAHVKNLTGGDTLSARFLFEEFFEFKPQFKMILIGNHKPQIKGRDHGIWRRINLVPFNVTIPKDEMDPELPQALKNEMPGILKWAVDGCLEWQRVGLNPPRSIIDAVNEYRSQEDLFTHWLADRCKLSPGAKTHAHDLLSSYHDYTNYRETTSNKLTGMLREISSLRDGKDAKGKYWMGIELVTDSKIPKMV